MHEQKHVSLMLRNNQNFVDEQLPARLALLHSEFSLPLQILAIISTRRLMTTLQFTDAAASLTVSLAHTHMHTSSAPSLYRAALVQRKH